MAKAKANLGKCCECAHDNYGVSFHPCTRNASIVRNGKPYCKQHDPERLAEQNRIRQAKWDAERKARNEEYRRRDAEKAACTGIPTEALESGAVRKLIDGVSNCIDAANGDDFQWAEPIIKQLKGGE